MKDPIIEYYPNGCIKHKIYYYNNGNKSDEYFRDVNGSYHRENMPAFQQWYENSQLKYKAYRILFDINHPAEIWFNKNGKIWCAEYHFKIYWPQKLSWMNEIKNV